MNMTCRLLVLLLVLITNKTECYRVKIISPEITYHSCMGSSVTSSYVYGSYPAGEENQYSVTVDWAFKAGKSLVMSFDSKAYVELDPDIKDVAEISKSQEENTFIVTFSDFSRSLKFKVKGPINGKVPYFNTIVTGKTDLCTFPMVGALDNMVKDSRIARLLSSSLPDGSCGRRKKEYMELIVSGHSVKEGDWPWHVAVYRLERTQNNYICGGTLISSFFVLTAAHCATINDIPVVPDILSVVLGKYKFIGGDKSSEERSVYSVIVHEEYGKPQRMDNDIALLKLMSKAIYTDFVQPACIWSSNEHYELLSTNTVGTVVGWGVTNTSNNAMSTELKQIKLPLVSKITCYEADLHLYAEILKNDKKFCAGYRNGSLPCNGDSGGGFMVFVPDASNDDSPKTGSWHVRGIVSITIPYRDTRICNPHQYAIFTDVSKYGDWIRTNTIVNETCSL